MSGQTGRDEREWDADTYRRVAAPQLSWGRAVLVRLRLRGDEAVADIGCGDGRVTVELVAMVPRGRVVACDRSANMTALARRELAPRGRAAVVQADATALPFHDAFDAVFSTATFHWVLDHAALFRSVHTALKPGGVLVAQCGGARNLARVLHHARAVAQEPLYAPFLEGWHYPVLFAGVAETADRLEAAGFTDVEVTLEPAPTPFPTEDACATFLGTVVLRLHVQQLPDAQRQRQFVREVTRRCARDEPPLVLDYQRLNVRARKRLNVLAKKASG